MPSLLILLALSAAAGSFVDPVNKALEAHAWPHPLLGGPAVEVSLPPPPNARGQPCDREVPDDKGTLTISAEQICFSRETTRVTTATSRDPDPQRWESWFATEHGETAHFEPEGEVWYFTECRGGNGDFKVFRESWKGCVDNGGVLTSSDRALALVTKMPPGIKHELWEIALTAD